MKARITDHALLRYLERVEGYDISDVRFQILTPELQAAAKITGGEGRIPVGDGRHMFVLKAGNIVSVVPK